LEKLSKLSLAIQIVEEKENLTRKKLDDQRDFLRAYDQLLSQAKLNSTEVKSIS